MTFTEVMRAVWTDVECLGNGYLELTRNGRGQIDGMYHVPGTTVRVLADRSGYAQVRDGRKRYFRSVGGEAVAVGNGKNGKRKTENGLRQGASRVTDGEGSAQNEMMHFSKYTPQSTYYGVPDIIPAVAAVTGDKAAREYNIDFFTHNAVPRMAIIVEGGELSDGVLAQLKQFMESEIKGQGHKTLVLEVPGSGTRIKLEKLTVDGHQDAAFLEYRKANRDEVLLVHRVPPSKVTVVENANLANSRDQDKTFREQVVRPEQRRIEYKLNRLVAEQLGIGDWLFRFREMDLTQAREEAEVSAIYADIGVLSAEEIRGKLGLEARDT
jgi:PBSX family phage portal protein